MCVCVCVCVCCKLVIGESAGICVVVFGFVITMCQYLLNALYNNCSIDCCDNVHAFGFIFIILLLFYL